MNKAVVSFRYGRFLVLSSKLLVLSLLCASCGTSYNIRGTSDVPALDGRMLYLKVYDDSGFKAIDSCDIVHGQFAFSGGIDSARMATLFMDDSSIMPLVIESGDILVTINSTEQRVSGTQYNEQLFDFMDSYRKLTNQLEDLSHQQLQAIMNGEDEREVNRRLNVEVQRIAKDEDELVTTFISDNFDNVLGPGVFFLMTANTRYPVLQPWIEHLWSKATDAFKNDAYVRDYYEKAQQNEAIMNGTAVPDLPLPPAAPTPNEMAQP